MNKHIVSIIFLFAAFLSALVSVFIPALFLPFSLASGILIAIAVATAENVILPLVFGVVSYALLWLITKNPVMVFISSVFYFPTGFAVGYSFKEGKNLNKTASASIFLSMAFLIATVVLFVFMNSPSGFSAEDAFKPMGDTLYETISTSFNSIFTDTEQLRSLSDLFFSRIIAILPALAGYIVFIDLLVVFWALKAIMKKMNRDVSHMGDFTSFRISLSGAIAYFIITILYVFSNPTDAFGIAIMNISELMTVAFAYAGISLLFFFIELKNFSTLLKVFIYAVAAGLFILFSEFRVILSLAGVVDTYINLREWLKNRGY